MDFFHQTLIQIDTCYLFVGFFFELLRKAVAFVYLCSTVFVYCLYKGEDVLSWKTCIWSYCHVFGQYNMFKLPQGCENIGKSSYLNLPYIGFTLFSPIKGRMDSLTVYVYKAETCTNILRYNTCMSSSPGDRKWTKIKPWWLYSLQFWPTRPWFFTSDLLHRSYGMIYGQ